MPYPPPPPPPGSDKDDNVDSGNDNGDGNNGNGIDWDDPFWQWLNDNYGSGNPGGSGWFSDSNEELDSAWRNGDWYSCGCPNGGGGGGSDDDDGWKDRTSSNSNGSWNDWNMPS